jgi:pyruvate carboxylase subunit B
MESQQEGGPPMTKGKYVASVGQSTFEIKLISDQSLEIDGKELDFDFKPLDDHSMSLILGGRTYLVECASSRKFAHGGNPDGDGLLGKTVVVSIKGNEYTVLLDDERSILFKKFVTKSHAASGTLVVRAPMPGLISRIEIQVGDEVSKGRGLLVLEAMKMENEIRAIGSGRVKAIHVEKGKPVEKDEPLITIEEL